MGAARSTGVVCRSSSPPAANTRSGLVLRQLDLQAGGSRRSYAQLSPGSAVGVAAGVAMPAGSGRRSGSAIAAQCTCLLRPSPKVWCRPALWAPARRAAPLRSEAAGGLVLSGPVSSTSRWPVVAESRRLPPLPVPESAAVARVTLSRTRPVSVTPCQGSSSSLSSSRCGGGSPPATRS